MDGCKIYVNGEYSGTSTWSSLGSNINGLLPGTYTLTITKPDYKDWSKQVEIASDETIQIYAYLEPL